MPIHLLSDHRVDRFVTSATSIKSHVENEALHVVENERAHESETDDHHDQDQTQNQECDEEVLVEEAKRHAVVGKGADKDQDEGNANLVGRNANFLKLLDLDSDIFRVLVTSQIKCAS